MNFTTAVNILTGFFGDELGNERRAMKRYVKKHPEQIKIVEAFEEYVKVVGMPRKGEAKIDWSKEGGKRLNDNEKPSDNEKTKKKEFTWIIYDQAEERTLTFRTARGAADYIGCMGSTVITAKRKKTLIFGRYAVTVEKQ